MELVVLLLVFIGIGMIGFFAVKKWDVFLEENRKPSTSTKESREDIIKIACENPIMLSAVSEAVGKDAKEFQRTSFFFYTGSGTDVRNMLEKEKADMIFLMEEPKEEEKKQYGEKESSFVPASLSEPFTGLAIEPVESKRKVMYALWKEECITEKGRKLLSKI